LSTEMDLAITLVETYTRAAQAQEALTLQSSLVDSLAEQATGLRAMFESSEATEIDAQEVEGRLAIARADLVVAEQELTVALRELAALTGSQPKQVLVPMHPFPEVPRPFPALERWLGWTRERAPRILLAREEERLA